ncbi:MAG: glycosyltransferase family 4 protein [Hydrogenophaga sp.]|nr:glycosyltransferase family 4 protein [Hydrogenophaga sp.]
MRAIKDGIQVHTGFYILQSHLRDKIINSILKLRTVTIVQRRLTQYRAPLFDLMADLLGKENIKLRLLMGQGTANERQKADAGTLHWAKQVPTRYYWGERLCWQPIRSLAAGSDLLILPQENALLANHSLLFHPPADTRLAFWGHGANLQCTNRDSWSERYKRWTTRQVDWWFAYTEMSVELVADEGFPRDRITCLNNAINVNGLRALRASITPQETATLRASLHLPHGFTGVFLGSLYEGKRLDFLFAAADQIKAACPDFSLVVIGAGPMDAQVAAMAAPRPWARVVGARHDREKALYLSLGGVLLNPGLVGLNVLDAFACGLPMLTTDCGLHSPEVVYLDATNGVMTPDSLAAYSASCIRLANHPAELAALRQGCTRSSYLYSIEDMAERFTEGIVTALGPTPSQGRSAQKPPVRQVAATPAARVAIVTNIPAPYRS